MEVVLPWVGSDKDVLDLGCLDGLLGELFVQRGNRVTGIDASTRAIEKAKTRGLVAKVGDLSQTFPVESASFDVVFAGEVIEHVGDVDHFINEVHRVLRPRGTLIVTTPNLASLGRRLMLLCNRNPYIENSPTEPTAVGHVRYFIRDTLVDFLKRHRFSVEACVSDVVSLGRSDAMKCRFLAKVLPSLGKSLIVKAVRQG